MFVTHTLSLSTNVMLPIPERTKASATKLPTPPTPNNKISELLSSSIAALPKSRSVRLNASLKLITANLYLLYIIFTKKESKIFQKPFNPDIYGFLTDFLYSLGVIFVILLNTREK